MDTPTIVVDLSNVPTSFQIATPFNYTFSSSGPYQPPPYVQTPLYIGSSIGSTPLAFSNTSPYSPENTLVSLTDASTGINSTVNKFSYTLSNISNGSVFAFELPYSSNGLSNGGIIQFSGAAQFTLGSNGTPGQSSARFNGGTWYSYVQGDSVCNVWNASTSNLDVTLVRAAGNISYGTVAVSSIALFLCNVNWVSTSTPVQFTITVPDIITPQPSTTPYIIVSSLTSPELLPFLSGSGSTRVTFSGSNGFQSIPSSNLTLWVDQVYNGSILHSNVTSNIVVTPISITVTPVLTSPLTISTYYPFSYVFSIPDEVVNVVLSPNLTTTTASLLPFLSPDATTFSSTTGLTNAGTTVLEIDAVLAGLSIIASNSTTINAVASSIVITPAIPSGSLNLYKYEPFSYVFTIKPGPVGITLQFTKSSSELQAFCTLSSDQSTVTFAGTFQVSYSTVLSLEVDLMYGTTIVGNTTIQISVGTGRFFPPAANQNFQLYQYENVSNTFGSNPSFLTVLAIDSIVSSPSLPSGLTFGGSCNTFYLKGTPGLQTAQNNYQIIGSNTTSGKIVTTTVSIKVNPQVVRLTPSVTTLTGLTVDFPITPVTITGIQPNTIYAHTFQYGWSGLPDGLSFQDINGAPFLQSGSPPDAALTIVLVGTPTLAFATLMSTSSVNLYQTRLTGYQTDQTGKQTTGSALINFSMAETVLINVSNSVPLYQFKPLGATDVVITAGSYFPSSSISNIVADALPPGLSLVQYTGPGSYHLVGTPTTVDLAGSYAFKAVNYNDISRAVTVTIPVNPDVVTFVSPTPVSGSAINFIVSRPLTSAKTGYYTTPIQFVATSAAAPTNPLTYTSSIDVTLYGLALNSTTGALTGIPTSALTQTSVTISATDALGTVGTTTILLTISADVFTWPAYTPTFFQNRAITSFQFVMVSTLSDRIIQSYYSSDLPTGLVLSPSGTLSGTTTVSSGTTFHVTATTGYSILTQAYSYTLIPDQLLILEVGGSTPVSSTLFSNVKFQTIDYATDVYISPTYTITDLYPPQPVPPIITVDSNGTMTGDFRNGLPSTYTATLNATYKNATGLTPVKFSFTPITVPVLTAVYNRIPNTLFPASRNNGAFVKNTTNYVFPGPVKQQWGNTQTIGLYNDGYSYGYYYQMPDISRLGSNYVATGSADPSYPPATPNYGVWSGVYSSTTSNIVWTSETLEVSGNGSYPAVANDGSNTWVIVSLPSSEPSSNSGIWTRTGNTPNTWTKITSIVTTVPTLGYMGSNFVIGNSGLGNSGYNCYSTRVQYANKSSLGSWTTSATLPAFSNVTRFATSNSTLVAIGNGASVGVFPLAYSTDSASNWITVTTGVSELTGGAVILNDLLYGNGTWVLCGVDSNSASFIAYSTDLSNWSFYTIPTVSSIEWSALAFNGNAWTIAGSSNAFVGGGYVSKSCLLSLDAGTWATQSYSIDYGTVFSNFDSSVFPKYKINRLASAVYPVASSTGNVYIPDAISDLTFTLPTTSTFNLFQYVPYSIPFQATGSSNFIYYYTPSVPIGFSFVPDSTGTIATLAGISPSNNTTNAITVYAKTSSGYPAVTTRSLITTLPYFVSPQLGAGAYTGQVRIAVEANAAQNARDNKVFPQVDPLAGPFMGPRAPDVITSSNCFLKLCKKPCPTCHTMM